MPLFPPEDLMDLIFPMDQTLPIRCLLVRKDQTDPRIPEDQTHLILLMDQTDPRIP
jgi:hypothetical protein